VAQKNVCLESPREGFVSIRAEKISYRKQGIYLRSEKHDLLSIRSRSLKKEETQGLRKEREKNFRTHDALEKIARPLCFPSESPSGSQTIRPVYSTQDQKTKSIISIK